MDLIGGYSDSDTSEEENEPEIKAEAVKTKPKVKLPPPDLTTASTKADEVKKVIYLSQDSVFVSNYDREEQAARKILEQHVTLSDNQAGKFEKERDGKKICWNFRKGRCYKGHNCPLFHDGDLKATAVAEKNVDQHVRVTNRGPSDNDMKRILASDHVDDEPGQVARKKKRHGLTDKLAPVKGAMKNLENLDRAQNPHRYTPQKLPENAVIKQFPR